MNILLSMFTLVYVGLCGVIIAFLTDSFGLEVIKPYAA